MKLLDTLAVDRIISLGDSFGYGTQGYEVFDLLSQYCDVCLRGNHEAMLLGELPLEPKKDELYRLSQARSCLTADCKKHISSLQASLELTLGGKRLLFVHGSPSDPVGGYQYADSDFRRFAAMPYDAIFMGHTHRPYVIRQYDKLFVNAGSCGMPRDIGNKPSFAVYDTISGDCSIIRANVPREEIAALENKVSPGVYACYLRNITERESDNE